MGTLLVVDGSDICRAPIVAFTLQQALAGSALPAVAITTCGLIARVDETMCESAAMRLGFTGPAISFYGTHRAAPLTVADIASADLVLTAERAQRSAVVRLLPGTQATVFTWKEALVLATALVERRRTGALSPSADLPALARALHGARGTVPFTEPPIRTGVFHWRRSTDADPLTMESGHDGRAEHRRITQEALGVAGALGNRFAALMLELTPEASLSEVPARGRRVGRMA